MEIEITVIVFIGTVFWPRRIVSLDVIFLIWLKRGVSRDRHELKAFSPKYIFLK